MPSPSSALGTLRPDIAGSLMEWEHAQNQMGFIGTQVMPIFEVGSASGKFGRIPLEQLLQKRDTKRAPGSRYNRGQWEFKDDSYTTQEHGWEEPVDENESNMYADYFEAEMVSAMRALGFVQNNAEARIAALAQSTTFFGTPQTAGGSWLTPATDIISDVNTARRNVRNKSGYVPNFLAVEWDTFEGMRINTGILDRIASSGAGESVKASEVTRQQVSQALGIEVLVAGAVFNNSAEGQEASLSGIWNKNIVHIGVRAQTNDIREPCVGRVFHWGEDGSVAGGTVETYDEPQSRSEIVRVRHQVDEKALYGKVGTVIEGVNP